MLLMKSRPGGATAPGAGSALGDFAEELGALLGNTERKASEWLSQRTKVTEQLTAIRDKATSLLAQMGHAVADTRLPGRASAAGRGNGTSPRARKSGRRKGGISEETRMKMAEAARRRWAAVRKKAKD